MSGDGAPEPDRTPGWGETLTGIFAVRRPTRLITDGVFVMLAYFVIAAGYSLAEVYQYPRTGMQEDVRTYQLFTQGLGLVSRLAYDLAWVLIAVGCARLIADGVARRTSTPS